MGDPAHQLPYKRPIKGWKRWVGVPKLKKKKPNDLAYGRVYYKNNNKRKNLQQRSKGLSCEYQ